MHLAICVPDPRGGSTPVCAYTDEYFEFLRVATYAPLFCASGAYLAYALMRVDFGHYLKTSRLMTAALSYVLTWLSLAAAELAFVLGVLSASTFAWSPGLMLLGAPASAGAGILLALLVDMALGMRPALAPHPDAGWLLAFVLAAVLALTPPLVSAARQGPATMRHWALAFGALKALLMLSFAALVFAVGRSEASAFAKRCYADFAVIVVPLLALWLLSSYLYYYSYGVLLVAALVCAFVILLVARTEWARRRRLAACSRYGRLVPVNGSACGAAARATKKL